MGQPSLSFLTRCQIAGNSWLTSAFAYMVGPIRRGSFYRATES
jgi:hypothetical protein